MSRAGQPKAQPAAAQTGASALATFGLAVICTIGAIGVFALEMLMAGSGMRAEVPAGHPSSKA